MQVVSFTVHFQLCSAPAHNRKCPKQRNLRQHCICKSNDPEGCKLSAIVTVVALSAGCLDAGEIGSTSISSYEVRRNAERAQCDRCWRSYGAWTIRSLLASPRSVRACGVSPQFHSRGHAQQVSKDLIVNMCHCQDSLRLCFMLVFPCDLLTNFVSFSDKACR